MDLFGGMVGERHWGWGVFSSKADSDLVPLSRLPGPHQCMPRLPCVPRRLRACFSVAFTKLLTFLGGLTLPVRQYHREGASPLKRTLSSCSLWKSTRIRASSSMGSNIKIIGVIDQNHIGDSLGTIFFKILLGILMSLTHALCLNT